MILLNGAQGLSEVLTEAVAQGFTGRQLSPKLLGANGKGSGPGGAGESESSTGAP